MGAGVTGRRVNARGGQEVLTPGPRVNAGKSANGCPLTAVTKFERRQIRGWITKPASGPRRLKPG